MFILNGLQEFVSTTDILTSISTDHFAMQNQPPDVFYKKRCFGVLEVSQNSQGNTCASVSFLIELKVWGLQIY